MCLKCDTAGIEVLGGRQGVGGLTYEKRVLGLHSTDTLSRGGAGWAQNTTVMQGRGGRSGAKGLGACGLPIINIRVQVATHQ